LDAPLQRLADQVRGALADGTPLRIRGTGSKDFYGGMPSGTPLDVAELRGICSYEPTEMVITARAGTPLLELEQALAEHGQCLSFEPPRYGSGGTLGGMVAAGLAGPARAAVGAVRDFVLGLTMIDGRGQVLQFGGQVMKNVAGYDVSRVMAGSLGVLGIIAEVSLKVPPVAAARRTLVIGLDQKAAIDSVQQWTTAAIPVRASAWQGGTLHLRLEGAQAAVESSVERLLSSHGAAVLDPAVADEFWSALRDQKHAFFGAASRRAPAGDGGGDIAREAGTLWRLSLPPAQPPLAMEGDTLIEWGGALRWLYSDAPVSRVRQLAANAGGHATAFRGAADRTEVFDALSAPLERIHRNLKAAFDPAGIFNPGRLYSWL